MPTIRKLHEDEVQKRGTKGESARAQVAREYDGYLADFAPNDYGEALVDEHESKLTVRNRLRAAAQRRGWRLAFLRTPGPVIRFRVGTADADQPSEPTGNAQEEEQVRQRVQADGPHPARRRSARAGA
jgi:hypothetical protein